MTTVKIANPLYYPIAVLVGAIVFVAGIRVVRIPSAVMLPTAAAIATVGAMLLKAREPERLNLDNPELEREILTVLQQTKELATKAHSLHQEATRLLTSAMQMELLGTVQYACDHVQELPVKMAALTRRFQGTDSLLSVQDLQQQHTAVQAKIRASSGIAREHLLELAQQLGENIELARQGQDARQAQIVSLSTLIQKAGGTLQALQNKLRTADLADADQTLELRSLSDELNSFQENVDLLVSK
jgi:chromosome segregation ATPase